MILAGRTRATQLQTWATAELKGYRRIEDVPDYRKISYTPCAQQHCRAGSAPGASTRLPSEPREPVNCPGAALALPLESDHVQCVPEWRFLLKFAQVTTLSPEVCKPPPGPADPRDCGSEWIDACGHSLPVRTAVLASCDSTSTPAAARSLSKRWISWKPRAA